MSTGYSWEGIRQVRATLLGARHVPERLCGGHVYLGAISSFRPFYLYLLELWLDNDIYFDSDCEIWCHRNSVFELTPSCLLVIILATCFKLICWAHITDTFYSFLLWMQHVKFHLLVFLVLMRSLIYTVSQKNVSLNILSLLRQIFTDFWSLFKSRISSKHATKLLLYSSPHVKHVATLPCEIQKIKISEHLTHLTPNTNSLTIYNVHKISSETLVFLCCEMSLNAESVVFLCKHTHSNVCSAHQLSYQWCFLSQPQIGCGLHLFQWVICQLLGIKRQS